MVILVLFFLLTLMGIFALIFFQLKHFILLKQRLDKISSPYLVYFGKEAGLSGQERFQESYLLNAKRMLSYLHVLTADTAKMFTKRLANAGWLSRNALIVFLSLQLISIFAALFLSIVFVFFYSLGCY